MVDWEALYNISPGYHFSFTSDGTVTNINQTMLSVIGLNAAEVINKRRLEELLTPGSRIFFQTHLFPLLSMQGAASELFLTFKTTTKGRIPVLLNAVADAKGEYHCSGMQISQRNEFEKALLDAKSCAEKALLDNHELQQARKKLEENHKELERQLRRITRISSEHSQINKVLTHDLQEPLRKIIFSSNRILEDNGNDADVAKTNLTKVLLFSDRIRIVINSMQRYHALDYKKIVAVPTNTSTMLQIVRKNKQIESACVNLRGGEIQFMADEQLTAKLLEEMLCNAIGNAHPDREMKIDIHVDTAALNLFVEIENKYQYADFVRINIKDNGIGFNSDFADQVFELFRKLHENDGLGVGLSYCRKIAYLHGGQISVISREGIGTEFSILLPVDHQVLF